MRLLFLPIVAMLLVMNPAAALEVLQVSREITTKGQAPVLKLYPGTGLNISFLETDETVYKIWFDDPSWASLDVEGSLEGDDLKGAKIIHLKRTQDLLYEHNITTKRTTLTLVTDHDIHRFVVEKADVGAAVYDTISIVPGQPVPLLTAGNPGLPVPDVPIPFPPALPGSAIQGDLPQPPLVQAITPIAPTPAQPTVRSRQLPTPAQEAEPPSLEQELNALKKQLKTRRQQEKQARKERRKQERQAKRERALRAKLERRRAKQRDKIDRLQAQIKALQGQDGDLPQVVQAVAIEVPPPAVQQKPAWQADTQPTQRSPLELAHGLSRGVNIARTLPRPEIQFSRHRHSNWVKIQRIIRRLRRGVPFEEAVAAERINPKYVRDLLAYGLQSR